MIHSYLSDLPCFQGQPFNYRQAESVSFTQFGGGSFRMERQFDVAPVFFNLQVVFTEAELGLFESWLHHVLKDVGLFSAKVRTGSQGVHQRALQLIGSGFEKNHLGGGNWQVSMQAISIENNYMTEGQTVLAMGVPPDFGTQVMLEVSGTETIQ